MGLLAEKHGEASARRGFEGPRWTFHAVGGALMMTIAIFVGLPYLEAMALRARPVVTPVPITRQVVALPPPLPVLTDVTPEPDVASPKPEYQEPASQVPVPMASLDLAPALGDIRPSFDREFPLASGVGQMERLDVFALADVDQAPVPLVRLEPRYPRDAELRRLEGDVVVEFVVDEAGACHSVEVVSSRPGRVFEQAAVRAIERWRFSPGTSGGRPVSVRVRQRVAFKLP
jgi:protein TonB